METKNRKPILAAILSFITPGLGQLYNGQLKKGIVFYLLIFLLSVLLAVTGLQYQFYGLLALIICGISAELVVSAEAFFEARKIKEITLNPFNKWYYYLLIVLLSIGIDYITSDIIKKDLLGIKEYTIPSGSMIPTLLIGDHLIIDLKHYKRVPPKKGDIIVFKSHEDPSKVFLKRIVGTEGDILESKDKTIYINGNVLAEHYVVHNDLQTKPLNSSPRDNFGPLTIPSGKVFVMGDNRDQSYDSRFSGYVDNTEIIGKVLYIYWSKQINKIGREIK
jgi:signal peptidase I